MINFLSGQVTAITEQTITLQMGGIGFAVQVPHPQFYKLNKDAQVYIHLHWNQENGPSLFGFSSELEKTIFLLITSCSGIGPKIALSILQQMQPGIFIKAVQTGDEKAFNSVNGIGPKKAEQMMVQLRHKINKLIDEGLEVSDDEQLHNWKQVSEVLSSLNYSRSEINHALSHLQKSDTADVTFDQLLRSALSYLSKRV